MEYENGAPVEWYCNTSRMTYPSATMSNTNFKRVYPGLNSGILGVRLSSEEIGMFNAKVHFVS